MIWTVGDQRCIASCNDRVGQIVSAATERADHQPTGSDANPPRAARQAK